MNIFAFMDYVMLWIAPKYFCIRKGKMKGPGSDH